MQVHKYNVLVCYQRQYCYTETVHFHMLSTLAVRVQMDWNCKKSAWFFQLLKLCHAKNIAKNELWKLLTLLAFKL